MDAAFFRRETTCTVGCYYLISLFFFLRSDALVIHLASQDDKQKDMIEIKLSLCKGRINNYKRRIGQFFRRCTINIKITLAENIQF